MKIEILEVAGLIPAMEALRLPYGREPRSHKYRFADDIHDNDTEHIAEVHKCEYVSKEDLALARRLVLGGDAHSKCLRGVIAYLRVTAPRYWWQEAATHRIGCECLSSGSTMHTIARGVTPDMFGCPAEEARQHCERLRGLIDAYNAVKAAGTNGEVDEAFLRIKRHIPECLLQTRVLAVSYQTLRRIWLLRHNHRLPEWRAFCGAVRSLPFADDLILAGED